MPSRFVRQLHLAVRNISFRLCLTLSDFVGCLFMRRAFISNGLSCLALLALCAVMFSCGNSTEEHSKQEVALYNDLFDQLAWQSNEICSDAGDINPRAWSVKHADSVKSLLRSYAEKRPLYYHAKIGALHKVRSLGEWFTVEITSWDRFHSTFSGVPANKVIPALTASSSLNAGALNLDYMKVVQRDTASAAPRDSSSALIGLSKPFYHEDRNRAVVYFETVCGSLKARGELLMVRLKDNKWQIEERRPVWTK